MYETLHNLYYMAHAITAAKIALDGILSYNNPRRVRGFDSIADPEINNRRHLRTVGGRSIHDYVPLYWATHTPMQYVQTVRDRVIDQQDLVFFVLDATRVLTIDGVWTTDGNAASSETSFFQGRGYISYLDWNVLRTKDCYSKEYKRKEAAEVLVPDLVPLECVRQICFYDEKAIKMFHLHLDLFRPESHTAMLPKLSELPQRFMRPLVV